MPYLSMSYKCHKFVRLSGSGSQMKLSRKLHRGSGSAYHSTVYIAESSGTTRFICHCRARGLLLSLGWGCRQCELLRAGGPRLRGVPASARGPPARRPARRLGQPTGDPPTYEASWVCKIVPGLLVPSLRSLRLCPAPPGPRSMVRRLNSVPAAPGGLE